MRTAADPELFTLLEPDVELGSVILRGSYSREADTYFWPPRRRCPLTATPVEPVALPARGVIWSWSFVHFPLPGIMSTGAASGYGACLVDIPEGPRVMGVLIGEMGDWSIGDPVVGVAVDLMQRQDDMLCVLGFRSERQP